MYVVHVVAHNKERLSELMLHALKEAHELGDLDGLIHIKDDTIEELQYGWKMTSHWDTLEKEVSISNNQDLLNNNFIYQKCLEKTTDLLYELLHRCRGSAVLPGINDVLIQVTELLEKLEINHDGI